MVISVVNPARVCIDELILAVAVKVRRLGIYLRRMSIISTGAPKVYGAVLCVEIFAEGAVIGVRLVAREFQAVFTIMLPYRCLLYTSDAADEL